MSIDDGYRRGVEAWPQLELSRATFDAHVTPLLPGNDNPAWPDLFIAAAVCAGVESAVTAFESAFRSYIEVAAARVDGSRDTVDETTQRVLEIVLYGGDTRAPAIAGYAGRGSLRGWLRLIARREALRGLAARRGESLDDSVMLDLIAPDHDPELALLKANAASALRAALLESIASLPRDRRAILRLSLLDGLSIDQIAPLYQIHRGTVARRLEAARKAILAGTRERLKSALEIGSVDVESLIQFARSQIDLCLEEALVSAAGDEQ